MKRWWRKFLCRIKRLFKMRRKISLYIADQLADLDDQSFILFNYTMDDLSNPTIVKNSFSQQISLKGTPANNRIFGEYYKGDRKWANTGGDSGVDYNAARKTPFTIYDEMGDILESGYVKLDSIERNGADIQYKVTLYGGLGSFFYALSYDEEGNRRTLADLDYLGTGDPTELDFIINYNAVLEAWRRLTEDTTAAAKWDVINFAPAYNGIPEGNFSPDKAIVFPDEVGLADSIPKDGVTYTTKNGYALVNFANPQDEWAVKDLRSYLQRPVLSMSAFWNAIARPENNGGYTVDVSAVTGTASLGFYAKLWMTLPLIPSLGSFMQKTGDLVLHLSSTSTSSNSIATYALDERDPGTSSVPTGSKITADINCIVRFRMPSGANSYTSLPLSASRVSGRTYDRKFSIIFMQAVAYGSDNTIVGGSKIKVGGLPSGVAGRYTGEAIAQMCGFTPAFNQDYERVSFTEMEKVSTNYFRFPGEQNFKVEATDVDTYKIMMWVYTATSHYVEGSGVPQTITITSSGQTSTPPGWVNYSTSYTPTGAYVSRGEEEETVTYTTGETLRSGSHITKSMLLSSSHTPAEYMLSFCKIFGLYFIYDPATRAVTVTKRNNLYQDETIDLTKRVDLSKGVSIKPLVFDAKWYDFALESVGGAFNDEYVNVEGIPYGIHRVNTGYDFNAETVPIMDSVVFKNACTVLARSKYFNVILQGTNNIFIPSQFLDPGNTYTLWSPTGESLDTDIPCPPTSARVTYYNENPDYKGYDVNTARKLELRTADNKPIDGADILVFHEGFDHFPHFDVTDDLPIMDTVNDGVPCWLIVPDAEEVYAPTFSRYTFGNNAMVENSLDFGIPRQFDIPGIRHAAGCTVYDRGWKNYISDRYDVNTKVMTCRVDFSGMQVGQDLLRKFYWYDNSLWVLNAIRNYSLTTYDPVECEFVQVQDKSNYLNGQTY